MLSSLPAKWNGMYYRLECSTGEPWKNESDLHLVVCDTQYKLCYSRYQNGLGALPVVPFTAVITGVQCDYSYHMQAIKKQISGGFGFLRSHIKSF